MKQVLDKGYVILQDYMGSDLSPVNAARVSYDKKKEALDDKDERLLRFLAREGHSSPFRHAALTFEVYAPLLVARQWWKYAVSSAHLDDQNGWNESSRRYITEEPEFHIPGSLKWRSKPENSKQGSGKNFGPLTGRIFTGKLLDHVGESERLYEEALEAGIAPEQARLFLPAYAMYVRWYWTVSLQGVAHFLNQRLEHDAQFEIQQYARAIHELAAEKFPVSLEELLKVSR